MQETPCFCPKLCRLRRFIVFESQLFLHLVADEEFLNLARNRHRESADKFYIAWHFVMSDLPLTKSAHFVFRQSLALAYDNPRAKLFAVFRIWHANDLNFS